ncbi:dienelactone hydrolase family protein [Microbispora sp. GKU 823]|uniref:dienelactone hydrolase family protein n=1 Tax=Microbispora sp. GKU 823 TaxID=1652100 RepID=UPI00277B49C4|nr:alpha/beta hydrolase [Microbispora sp. GKU 823]
MSDVELSVRIPIGEVVLDADVAVPREARGAVLFAHGSGSGRHSPRNRYVARELQRAGLATVLADLLTAEEERVDAVTGHLRFDIGLLADRVGALADRLPEDEVVGGLPVGLFGASTGAAAALVRRGDAARRCRGGGVQGRQARSRRGRAPLGAPADAADRGGARLRRPRPQPGGDARDHRAGTAGDRAARHASVRGAGRARDGRAARPRLVPAPSGGWNGPRVSCPATI